MIVATTAPAKNTTASNKKSCMSASRFHSSTVIILGCCGCGVMVATPPCVPLPLHYTTASEDNLPCGPAPAFATGSTCAGLRCPCYSYPLAPRLHKHARFILGVARPSLAVIHHRNPILPARLLTVQAELLRPAHGYGLHKNHLQG